VRCTLLSVGAVETSDLAALVALSVRAGARGAEVAVAEMPVEAVVVAVGALHPRASVA
jgi:hypothetical protein